MSVRPVLGACLASLTLAPLVAAPQASKISWVQVLVTDAGGGLVTSPTREDFNVLNDERPADVTVFSKNELPMAISIMLDRSGSMFAKTLPARQSVRLLVDEFIRGDRVNLGVFDSSVAVSDRFTANRARIFWTLEQPSFDTLTPCAPPQSTQMRGASPAGGGTSRGGTRMWDGVWCGLRELQRDTESIRKILLLLTDGVENASMTSEDQIVRLAQASGVMVYSVGFRGENNARGDRRLRDLATPTGGRYFPVEEEDPIEPVFRQIGKELRSAYVLGFTPRNAAGTLRVQVRRAGLTVRAQARYSRLAR